MYGPGFSLSLIIIGQLQWNYMKVTLKSSSCFCKSLPNANEITMFFIQCFEMSLLGSLLERLHITCGPITTSGGCWSRPFVKACGHMERVLIPNNYTVWSVLAPLTCSSYLPCHQHLCWNNWLQWDLSSSGRGQRAGRDCRHGIVLFEDTINPITLKWVFKWKVTLEKKGKKCIKVQKLRMTEGFLLVLLKHFFSHSGPP